MAQLQLTEGQKNVLDTVLGLAGMVLGLLTQNILKFPTPYDAVGPVVGAIGGYFVTDALSIVDTGHLPPNTVPTQLAASWKAARPVVVAEIANLPAADQDTLKVFMAVLDAFVASQPPAP